MRLQLMIPFCKCPTAHAWKSAGHAVSFNKDLPYSSSPQVLSIRRIHHRLAPDPSSKPHAQVGFRESVTFDFQLTRFRMHSVRLRFTTSRWRRRLLHKVRTAFLVQDSVSSSGCWVLQMRPVCLVQDQLSSSECWVPQLIRLHDA